MTGVRVGRSPVGSDAEIVVVGAEAEESIFERARHAVRDAMDDIAQARITKGTPC